MAGGYSMIEIWLHLHIIRCIPLVTRNFCKNCYLYKVVISGISIDDNFFVENMFASDLIQFF